MPWSVDPAKLRAARGTRRREAVALQIGRSFPSISGYESGTITPSTETLLALAQCYGVPVEQLCSNDEAVDAR